MRISTANAFDEGVNSLMRRQGELADSQTRLTSLKRVNKASDDPAAAARAERALASVLRADTTQRAVEASRSVMMQTEGALADAGELLQQAREGLVAAGNASYSDAERKGLAEKLSAIRQQLLVVANRSDGAGTYLFGGQGLTRSPFLDRAGGVAFEATEGQARTESSSALPLSVDGKAVWLSARTGNGVFKTEATLDAAGDSPKQVWIDSGRVVDPGEYFSRAPSSYAVTVTAVASATDPTVFENKYSVTRNTEGALTALVVDADFTSGKAIEVDGISFTLSRSGVATAAQSDEFVISPSASNLSVFDVLDKAVADLSKTLKTGAQRAQFNSENLRDLDSVMTTLQSARSVAGEVLTLADNETSRLGSQKLSAQNERSKAEDLDMVEAISDFKNRQTSYDAALQTYSMVQRLSLFQYING